MTRLGKGRLPPGVSTLFLITCSVMGHIDQKVLPHGIDYPLGYIKGRLAASKGLDMRGETVLLARLFVMLQGRRVSSSNVAVDLVDRSSQIGSHPEALEPVAGVLELGDVVGELAVSRGVFGIWHTLDFASTRRRPELGGGHPSTGEPPSRRILGDRGTWVIHIWWKLAEVRRGLHGFLGPEVEVYSLCGVKTSLMIVKTAPNQRQASVKTASISVSGGKGWITSAFLKRQAPVSARGCPDFDF